MRSVDSSNSNNAKVGYNQQQLGIIVKAMKRIEDKTCIRFKRINPEPGKK